MMQEVPKADVVVTNPTHYAVALRYDQARMRAPRVVAKGADLMAAQIRQVALAHGVPIYEAPPLARALHASSRDRPGDPGRALRRGRAAPRLRVRAEARAGERRAAP